MRTKYYDEGKIYRLNKVYKVSNKIAKSVIPQLDKFIGKKIETVDGYKTKSFDVKIPDIKIEPLTNCGMAKVHMVRFTFGTRLGIKLTINFWGGSYKDNTYYCHYEDNYILLGEMDGQKLTAVYEYNAIDIINPDKQAKLIRKYNSLLDQLSDINNQIRI